MKKRTKKGFTLIEMLAAVAIFSVISVALVTMVTTTWKFNAANKTTFDANANSRAFYELIRENRPTSTRKYPTSGNYYNIFFNDQSELSSFVKNNFNNTLVGYTPSKDFNSLKTDAGTKRYAIQVHIEKKEVINPSDNTKKTAYYELITQSYDITKGEYTEIERKAIIAEE